MCASAAWFAINWLLPRLPGTIRTPVELMLQPQSLVGLAGELCNKH
jgi:hypothetical protein